MFDVRSVRPRLTTLALACFTLVGLAVAPRPAKAAPSLIYSGQIGTNSPGDNPGNVVEQGGGWTAGDGVTLSWEITYDPDTTYWGYTYTFTRPDQGNLSHFTLELTPGTEVFDANTGVEYGNFGPDSGNPGIPGSIGWGVKFEPFPEGNPLEFSFNSFRAPVWGDFYAKDGNAGSDGTPNAAWNLGFTDADPLAPAANGQLLGHILRPDMIVGPPPAVPEPATFATAGLGVLMGLGYAWRRRKRAAV